MRVRSLGVGVAVLISTSALAAPSGAEQMSIFKAAGFAQHGRQWRSGNCEPPELSYEPGSIAIFRDLNGDGRPEAVVTEGGGLCYGNTGQNFWMLSKQSNGAWKVLIESLGMPQFMPTKGVNGYPDLLIGGPGFCFPVLRWNGRAYARHHFEYESRPCRPPS
ncbi:hypothetical protein [Sphingobium chungbukense]|uniref:Uncharacterized protein n=1 Tax=Sphingobium chungbukense TaxID=56193 RepID=A0A0M3AKI8_9SPHN|nr:hypothetical protein [Sphingobium chungbukense]KKW90612.1 hypothetical protein YP76_18705 [Sphingobium chungbukense]